MNTEPTDVSRIAKQVRSRLKTKGYRGQIVSIGHIADLKAEIDSDHRRGLLDELFYGERLTGFQFSLPESFPNARSIIIASAPQMQQKVTFRFEGRTRVFTIPPTYSTGTDRLMEKLIMEVLEPTGYSIHEARLPEKLLAVRCGLAKYGKNNVTYTEGLGSFHRPIVILSDLPVVEDTWGGLEMMEQCHKCTACIKKCPTNAIPSDRFLIHAERCLTFHNERAGEFPDWIDPGWHNSLIGCMVCQSVCPVNREIRNQFEEGESFTEKETSLLLGGVSADQLPKATADKLERLGLLEDVGLISRNLSALLRQRIS
jgi:epoxyqueuosine reductase